MSERMNPFPGLRPFRAHESALFFGRDEQTGDAIDRLLVQRLLAVVGVSGCGKSSLARAGMVAAVEFGLAGDPAQSWRLATMRPGVGPMARLADCLGIAPADCPARTYALREIAAGQLKADENLLLLVDQFEELFDYRMTSPSACNNAALFVSNLISATRDPKARVFVVLTMRSDFLGECAKFDGLPEALSAGQFLVPRLTRDQLQEAIELPLKAVGVDIHPALVQDLLNQCNDEPDNLPILQHLLKRIFEEWERRGAAGAITMDIAKAVGGFDHALDRDAESVRLTQPERLLAEQIFRRITEARTQGERDEQSRPVRRPQTLDALANLCGVLVPEARTVVNKFAARDLLVLQGEKVDLAHECLCLKWQRLSEWIRTEQKDARSLRYLDDSVDKNHLSGVALADAVTWLADEKLLSAWPLRYLSAERVDKIVDWIRTSERQVLKQIDAQRALDEKAAGRRAASHLEMAMKGGSPLSGVRVWVTGRIPEYTSDAERSRVVAFVRAFVKVAISSGGQVIHDVNPSLTPVILEQMQQFQGATGRSAPLTLMVSEYFRASLSDYRGWQCQVVPSAGDRQTSLQTLRQAMLAKADVLVYTGGSEEHGFPPEVALAGQCGVPVFVCYRRGFDPEAFRYLRNGLSIAENKSLCTGLTAPDSDRIAHRVVEQIERLPLGRIQTATGQRFRVLCLDGGGVRVAFMAAVLATWEEQTGWPIASHFDLIAGTGFGGVLAIGLALGLTARELLLFARDQSVRVYSRLASNWFSTLLSFYKSPGHKTTEMEALFRQVFGTKSLGECRQRLVIPCYDITNDRLRVFRTSHTASAETHDGLDAVTVARATSALPFYFKAATVERGLTPYEAVDGGLWAASPALVAITEAVQCLNVSLDRLDMLDIGLAPQSAKAPEGEGLMQWAVKLPGLLLRAQHEGILMQAKQLLGDRFVRIDEDGRTSDVAIGNISSEGIDHLIEVGCWVGGESVGIVRDRFLNGVRSARWR